MENRTMFELLDKEGNMYFRFGRVSYSKANMPLSEHTHGCLTEIVLMVRGSQIYRINSQEYRLNSSQAFITLPNELHGSGDYPEDKSLIYYLIADLKSSELCLGYDQEETDKICDVIYSTSRRVIDVVPRMKEICDLIMHSQFTDEKHRKTALRNLISEFFLKLSDCITEQVLRDKCGDLKNVLEYIENNIENDISVQELAQVAGLSVSRFKVRFRETVGLPPHEYILRSKLEQAKILLANTDNDITDIAYMLGFSSSQYFSTVFKRYTCLTPCQYNAIIRLKD